VHVVASETKKVAARVQRRVIKGMGSPSGASLLTQNDPVGLDVGMDSKSGWQAANRALF